MSAARHYTSPNSLPSATGLVTQLLEPREDQEVESFHTQLERMDLVMLYELGYVLFCKAAQPVSQASGRPSCSYEAAWNLIMPNCTSCCLDMHEGRDRGDGTDIAGD